jgi:hypothetical protein
MVLEIQPLNNTSTTRFPSSMTEQMCIRKTNESNPIDDAS